MDRHNFTISEQDAGQRLDIYLAEKIEDISRAAVQRLISGGMVMVDGEEAKANYRLKAEQMVQAVIVPPEEPSLEPENIPLDILYEDEFLIVLNKQPGLVVHPATGHSSHTLVNALLYHCEELLDTLGDGVTVEALIDPAFGFLFQRFGHIKIGLTDAQVDGVFDFLRQIKDLSYPGSINLGGTFRQHVHRHQYGYSHV